MINSEKIMDESSQKLEHLVQSSVDSKLIVTQSKDSESRENEDDLEFPTDDDILDMVKDVNLENPLPTVTERYFTTYYRMNFPKEGDDICIRMHTNRLCMISLAPSHEIFQNNRIIEKIDFQVTEKLNRADNTVSGKAKHGAQPLHESSKICTITCKSGETWTVRCGMNGKLTEANTDLLKNPELLREPPHKGGYLAIVLPKINGLDKLKKQLVTQDIYDTAVRDRSSTKIENGSKQTNGTVKRPCEKDVESAECRVKIMKTDVATNEQKIVDEKSESSMLSCT